MEQPIDLDNLRRITGGDADMEKELFQIFLESGESCIKNLHQVFAADDSEGWKSHAHAFKGLSLNLGANPLGALCNQAQQAYLAARDEKQKLLTSIEAEFARVQESLKTCQS